MSSTLLKDIYFFKTFTQEELDKVVAITERKQYHAGQQIFNRGDMANRMYFLEIGTVEIAVEDKVLAQIGKGGVFGEMPFLDAGDRSATARTLEETHLIEIDYADLNKVLLNSPEMALKFYIVAARYVSKRLRAFVEH